MSGRAQSTVIYAALIGTGIVMVQPYLTSTDLGTPAFISVAAGSSGGIPGAVQMVWGCRLLGDVTQRL